MTENVDLVIKQRIEEIESKLRQYRKDFKKRYDEAIKAGASPNDPLLKCAEDIQTMFEETFNKFFSEYKKAFPENNEK